MLIKERFSAKNCSALAQSRIIDGFCKPLSLVAAYCPATFCAYFLDTKDG